MEKEISFERGRQGPCISRPVPLQEISTQVLETPHKAEIQTLSLKETFEGNHICTSEFFSNFKFNTMI